MQYLCWAFNCWTPSDSKPISAVVAPKEPPVPQYRLWRDIWWLKTLIIVLVFFISYLIWKLNCWIVKSCVKTLVSREVRSCISKESAVGGLQFENADDSNTMSDPIVKDENETPVPVRSCQGLSEEINNKVDPIPTDRKRLSRMHTTLTQSALMSMARQRRTPCAVPHWSEQYWKTNQVNQQGDHSVSNNVNLHSIENMFREPCFSSSGDARSKNEDKYKQSNSRFALNPIPEEQEPSHTLKESVLSNIKMESLPEEPQDHRCCQSHKFKSRQKMSITCTRCKNKMNCCQICQSRSVSVCISTPSLERFGKVEKKEMKPWEEESLDGSVDERAPFEEFIDEGYEDMWSLFGDQEGNENPAYLHGQQEQDYYYLIFEDN